MNRLFGMDSPLMVALMKIGDLLCLSVLWLVFSLPIFTIGASSSSAPTYAHLIARDENAEGWETFGAVWNARIDENIAPIELFFTSEGEGSAELRLHLGKITPNPDNAEDTTPENFTVTIDKIELYKITGEEHEGRPS